MGGQQGRAALAWGCLALGLIGACGRESAAKPPAAQQLVAQPGPLTVNVTGTSATVSWRPPAGLTAPLTGYRFYLDQVSPVKLGPQVTSRSLTGLQPGSQHFVQVVALAGQRQSAPATATVEVPANAPPATPLVRATPMNTSFVGHGVFELTLSAGAHDATPCDAVTDYYKVQVYEEHEAYEGDARLSNSGRRVSKTTISDTVVWTCAYPFSGSLDGTSLVYDFRLVQYRAGRLEDAQKVTTSRLRAGTKPVLTAN